MFKKELNRSLLLLQYVLLERLLGFIAISCMAQAFLGVNKKPEDFTRVVPG